MKTIANFEYNQNYCKKKLVRLGCTRLEEPPPLKTKKLADIEAVRKVAHAQKRNPLSDLDKTWQIGKYPGSNHIFGIFWKFW